ncbi:PqqD family protein [Paraclostridium bifermentans]|uniref:PqqD family protein n=1 Tax=Paraclostridium TaxID=1849822 RepID=UPI00038DB544|nr:PqqD family protein [Paraclostridium bifermentans]MDV8116348.1 PqqD family protein [Bacillus sp. BAU-SS-2023]EQK39084.1 coenzyme PQQ synthesis D family protein [[Clostridium] bifermentans ATCC 19299] [Paraclostridium bifermentans ATCC 19299]MCE9675378.1 PqqD family protein [Paraclostridium bifermentans]MCR1875806.1 PqqD family protein [Paraclostridium bifermentans]TQO56526.1 PqqD family protein [Paraclostridium bifermentans]
MKNNEEVLNLVFKKSENIEYEVSSDGIVTILEKQDHKVQNFFRKLKFKIPMYKKMELDEYGSFIFLQIDGKKNVEELGIKLEEKYGEKSHPLYERLLLFLNHIDVNCHYIEKIN